MLIRTLENHAKRDGITSIGDITAFIRHRLAKEKFSDTGVVVTESNAMTLPWAYSAINVLSETLAHVPLEVRRKSAKGGSVPAIDHPLYDTLHSNPSSGMSSFNWRKTMESHRNGWGNGMTWIRRRPGVQGVTMQLLLPDRTEILINKQTGDVIYRSTLDDGTIEDILGIDVLHVPSMTFDGVRGISPPALLKLAFASGLNVQQFGAMFFGKGANPRAIIESELGGNSYTKSAEEFKEKFGGLDNAMGTPVLPKGFKYVPTTINPNDAQFLETAMFNRSVIAGIYRVPAHFINDQEKNTFTNAGEMDLSFAKHSMVPIYANYEQEMARKLLTPRERATGYFIKFNVNGLLRGSQEERYKSYHTAINDGWMNRNTPRRLEDFEEVEGLDEYLVPQNMKAASQLLAPMVSSLAARIARQERRALEGIGEDTKAAAAFYSKQPEWLRNNFEPLAVSFEQVTGESASVITERFIKCHIEKQLSLITDSIAAAIPKISAAEITRTIGEATANGN